MGSEAFTAYLAQLFEYFERQNQVVFSDSHQKALIAAVNDDVIHIIQQQLGLTLLRQEVSLDNCYVTANHALRDEYKQFILPSEFFYFLYGTFLGIVSQNLLRTELRWPEFLPKDGKLFWECMRFGQKRR